MFGLLNLYVTNVKARHEFTEYVGATMFGTYNVISLVVLLNMLIAMMNNSYQLIAVSTFLECDSKQWSYRECYYVSFVLYLPSLIGLLFIVQKRILNMKLNE